MSKEEFAEVALLAGKKNGWELVSTLPERKKAFYKISNGEFCHHTVDLAHKSLVWGHYGFSSLDEALGDYLELS